SSQFGQRKELACSLARVGCPRCSSSSLCARVIRVNCLAERALDKATETETKPNRANHLDLEQNASMLAHQAAQLHRVSEAMRGTLRSRSSSGDGTVTDLR